MASKETVKKVARAVGAVLAVTGIVLGVLLTKEEHKVYLPMVSSSEPARYGVAGEGQSTLPYYGWNIGDIEAPHNFYRMVWCVSDEWFNEYENGKRLVLAATRDNERGMSRTWLVLNEPERPDQCGGQHISGQLIMDNPRITAYAYHSVYGAIKGADPMATIFVGGLIQLGVPETSQWWWAEFVDELDDNGWLNEIEGVHVHGYPIWSAYCPNHWPNNSNWCLSETFTALDNWYEDFHAGMDLADRPIWITEVGCASYVSDLYPYGDTAYQICRDNVMVEYQDWFDNQDNYELLFWFITQDYNGQWWPTALMDDGDLTPLGDQWLPR